MRRYRRRSSPRRRRSSSASASLAGSPIARRSSTTGYPVTGSSVIDRSNPTGARATRPRSTARRGPGPGPGGSGRSAPSGSGAARRSASGRSLGARGARLAWANLPQREHMDHFDVLIVGAVSRESGPESGWRPCARPSRSPSSRVGIPGRDLGPVSLSRWCDPTLTCSHSAIPSDPGIRPGRSRTADRSSATPRDRRRRSRSIRRVRYHHRVTGASWSSACEPLDGRSGRRRPAPEPVRYSTNFLYLCSGYYNYEQGYLPAFPAPTASRGQVVHPTAGRPGVDRGPAGGVVGSGATAVTLAPALCRRRPPVTLLQRSPSYVLSATSVDPLARGRTASFPERVAHPTLRWKNVLLGTAFYQLCRRRPQPGRRLLRAGAAKQLPAGYDVDSHFSPRYDPGTSGSVSSPDGDLFEAIRLGPGVDGDGSHRDLHSRWDSAGVGPGARRRSRRRRHRSRPDPCGGIGLSRRRDRTWIPARPSSTGASC